MFNIPDATVTITKIKAGQASVVVNGRTYLATYNGARRGWTLDDGQFSPSAKLHSIARLFNVKRGYVAGQAIPERPAPATSTDARVLRQVRRMLDSMDAAGFESYWKSHDEEYGCVTGHTVYVAGDPIYTTVGQVSGAYLSRAETMEAMRAVLDGRHANLPPRMQTVPAAIVRIAEALAAGLREVELECGLMEPILGLLPENWDGQEDTDNVEGVA